MFACSALLLRFSRTWPKHRTTNKNQELLAYYTVSQSAILIYLAVMTGLLTCLAWKVSEEELAQRQAAESRLKAQNPRAFELRERMILEHGRPGSRWEGREARESKRESQQRDRKL